MSLEPPPYFDKEARKTWVDTITQLFETGYHHRVDPNSLEAYVLAVHEVRHYTSILKTVKLIGDDNKPHPAVEQRRKASAIVAKFARQWQLNERLEATSTPPQPLGRWCEGHHRYCCAGHTQTTGAPCHSKPVAGRDRCRKHCGVKLDTDPAHLLAVEERDNPFAGKPVNITPINALLWRVQVITAQVANLDDIIASLQREELVWGKTRETEDEKGTATVYESRINTWIMMRDQRETALVRTCEVAIRAGVEERQVRIAEMQATLIYKFIMTVLADFGVRADDPRVGEIVPRRLAELRAS